MLESCVGPMSGSVTIFRKVDLGNVLVSFSELVMVRLVISNVILIMIALDPTGNGTVLNDKSEINPHQSSAGVQMTHKLRSSVPLNIFLMQNLAVRRRHLSYEQSTLHWKQTASLLLVTSKLMNAQQSTTQHSTVHAWQPQQRPRGLGCPSFVNLHQQIFLSPFVFALRTNRHICTWSRWPVQ